MRSCIRNLYLSSCLHLFDIVLIISFRKGKEIQELLTKSIDVIMYSEMKQEVTMGLNSYLRE